MPSQYILILIVAIVAAGFPAISLFCLTRVGSTVENSAVDSEPLPQEVPLENAAAKHSDFARLYIAGSLFVVLDVVIIFLCVWAVKFSQMGSYGLIAVLPFLGVILTGYAWLYKKNALDWS
jgi:NADH:ubiquinone oxidoreductase subunit 3 (subunit A)